MSLPIPPPTGVYSTHNANCHCSAIHLSFQISPPLASYPVVSCNCSICQRNGYLFVYPDKDNVIVETCGSPDQDEDEDEGRRSSSLLGSYQFGTEVISHKFCKTCGSSVFFEFAHASSGRQQPARAELAREVGDDGKPKLPNVVGVNVSEGNHVLWLNLDRSKH